MASRTPPLPHTRLTARLNRHALYLRVWTTPITELGLTGTALRVACRRYAIPTPRPGYWMKKEFGKPVEQPPLEDLDGMSAGTEINFMTRKSASPKASEKEARRPQERPANSPRPTPITQIATTKIPPNADFDLHPTLEGTPKKLLSPAPDGGLARAAGKGTFSVSVSLEQVARALLLLSKLLQAMETQGWSVTRSEKGLQLCLDGEAIGFTLTEQTDRVPHKLTDAERETRTRFEAKRAAAARRGDWFGAGDPPPIPEWDYRPTECFTFQLDPNPYAFGAAIGLRRTFSESRSRRLEDQVEKIIAALASRAAAMKEIRRLDAEREAQWAEEAARRKEAERRQRLETKRQEFLERRLERHHAARQLEDFLARYDRSDLQSRPEAARASLTGRGAG